MEGSGSSDATGAQPDRAVEDAAARAEQLFAGLTDQPREQRTNGSVRRPTAPSERPPPAAPALPLMADDPLPPRARSRGARDDRVDDRGERGDRGDRGDRGEAHGGVTTSQLVALSLAVEQALEAVDSRLTSLEAILLGERAPRDKSAELAVARLRRTLLLSGLTSPRESAGSSALQLDGDEEKDASTDRSRDP